MNTSSRTVFCFLPFVLLCLAAGVNPQSVVHAGDRNDKAKHSLKISFADLDLTSRQGTVTLYRRILNAARAVCGPVDIGLSEDRADWERCVDNAIANAIAKIGDANLTDYYLVKTNRIHTSVAHR
jgi:UrcA family protein